MKNILKSFAAFGIAPLVALGVTMGGAFAAGGGEGSRNTFRSTIQSRKSGPSLPHSELMTRDSFSAVSRSIRKFAQLAIR